MALSRFGAGGSRLGGGFGATTSGFGDTMAGIEGEYQEALAANEKRYAQAMAIYDEIISRYQPGGGFGKAALGQLEEQKVRDVGEETQAQISGGLFGTSVTAGLGTKWESEVGAPARLRLEDIMMERLSQAQLGKAGFIERREDVYPDVGAAAQYAAQAGGGGQTISGTADISGYMQRFNETFGGGPGGKTTGPGPGVASQTLTVGPGHGMPWKDLDRKNLVVTGKGPGGAWEYGYRGAGNV